MMSLVRSDGIARRTRLLTRSLVPALALAFLFLTSTPPPAYATHQSDENRDGVVDLQDLILFSEKKLRQDWQEVDWCQWIAEPDKLHRHREELIAFIGNHFACDPLTVVNANVYPTRLAWAPEGKLYVSDAQVGSVFIYERQPELTAVAELKNLSKPLGVALHASGALYVGGDGLDRVEVYDPQGQRTGSIGEGTTRMPNDLAFDASGNLYVADSQSNLIWVYDASGALVRSIGAGELRFPVAIEIASQELYVADQRNFQIKVFSLEGDLLRTLGGHATQGMLGYKWKGKFVRLQSLAIDATGRLHALDSHQGLIEILDPLTGSFLTSYGEKGTAPGQMSLPLDIALNGSGEMAVADAENKRVEILPTP
jgi:hypothetical protein